MTPALRSGTPPDLSWWKDAPSTVHASISHMEPGLPDAGDGAAFVAAWDEFATRCASTVAPEATYQAWLAHFLIERMELLRVVREVDFGARHLLPDDQTVFTGSNLMVDITILREPLVHLPRRAALARGTLPDGTPDPKSGLQRLADFAVVTELKVASSQIEGLDTTEVVRDFQKLSALLNAAERHYPSNPLPAAFVGVLDNHPTRRLNVPRLQARLAYLSIRPDVIPLIWSTPR